MRTRGADGLTQCSCRVRASQKAAMSERQHGLQGELGFPRAEPGMTSVLVREEKGGHAGQKDLACEGIK